MSFFYHILGCVTPLALVMACLPVYASDSYPPLLQQLCPKLALRGKVKLSFSETEKKLVCGDPKSESWKDIPHSQAFFNLRTFLQDKGYYLSTIASTDPFIIDLGSPSYSTGVVIKEKANAEPSFELLTIIEVASMRRLKGILLTPSFLDQVRDRLLNRIKSKGYPCPVVEMAANPQDGVITATVTLGPQQIIDHIVEDPIAGVRPNLLRRYDAFQPGQLYDDDLLTLTANRIVTSGVVQTSHLSAACSPSGAVIRETSVAGPPRQITLGFGLDTERIARFRASWRNARLGDEASSQQYTLLAALYQQEINAISTWYYLPSLPRHFLASEISFRHENEITYENLKGDIYISPSLTWDSSTMGFSTSLGPSFSWEHTFRPVQTIRDAYFSAIRADFRMTSHGFELNQASPQKGFDIHFQGIFAQQGVLSDVGAQRIGVTFQKLWNFRNYDPSFLIVGLRGGVGTTFMGSPYSLAALPPSLKHYLGGSENLRGFDRRELASASGLGGLTSAYLCFEVRFSDLLPWGIQPILFHDVGMLGNDPLTLKGPLYSSPGFGARWQSPIGVFRSTISHGFLSGDRNGIPDSTAHWKFYLSYGEEF